MSNLQWELSDADEPGVADLSLPLAGDLNRSLRRGQAPPAVLRASVKEPGALQTYSDWGGLPSTLYPRKRP